DKKLMPADLAPPGRGKESPDMKTDKKTGKTEKQGDKKYFNVQKIQQQPLSPPAKKAATSSKTVSPIQ
ncbi:MAG: hypothetical protein Q9M12_05835, partial [Mariprofundus sp.]|nr:hypothetical protein [Mariprofundus sp.]